MDKKTVLVVEDNDMNMKLTRDLLSLLDCDVLEANDAESGLKLVRDQRPDLVLMDIQLPGMDGLEACRKIREDIDGQDIPMIALTAMAMNGDEEKVLEAGYDTYISKPFDTKTFLEKVSGYLGTVKVKKKTVPKQTPSMKKLVLVVDDDKINVKVIKSMLPSDLYDILEAFHGTDALRIARERAPDLIFLDIMMPDIDGYEVAKRLKSDSETSDIPIVMVTSLDGTEDRVKGLEAGAEDVLIKPVNKIEVVARARSMVRLGEFRRQLTLRNEAAEYISLAKMDEEAASDAGIQPSILVVEDSKYDMDLLRDYLGYRECEVHTAQTAAEALRSLEENDIDLILLDIILPDMDGFEVLNRIRRNKENQGIQIIVVTALDDLESKVKGINLGADDYLIKPIDIREFEARVEVLLKKKGYIDRLRSSYEAAKSSAEKDSLTGLYNHAYLMRFLDLETKRAQRHNYPVSLAMIDIDDFREYNTRFGHLVGDLVIKEVAKVLVNSVREIDLVARYGGDEFTVVLPYCCQEKSSSVYERIREAMGSHPFPDRDNMTLGSVTVSMGFASFPGDAESSEGLIEKADAALFRDKAPNK